MKFEVSERMVTTADKNQVLVALQEQFRKVARSVSHQGETLEVKAIEASFGSINRLDVTLVELKAKDDGFLILASVNYRPSVAFWIILLITLFTWVFWLLPIAFYLMQKKTVRTAIADVFTRVKHEFQNSGGHMGSGTSLDQLEKLGALRDKGVLTEEEFQVKKKQLLEFGVLHKSNDRSSASESRVGILPLQTSTERSDPLVTMCPFCGTQVQDAGQCSHCGSRLDTAEAKWCIFRTNYARLSPHEQLERRSTMTPEQLAILDRTLETLTSRPETLADTSRQNAKIAKIGAFVLLPLAALVIIVGLTQDLAQRHDVLAPGAEQPSLMTQPLTSPISATLPTASSTQSAPEAALTAAQRNATRSAQSYLKISGFSRRGLIDQLSSEHGDRFSSGDATVAVDSLNIDWNTQAERSAAAYLKISGFSCRGLIEQLSSQHGDKYTVEQATNGAKQAGAC
jgi:Host cell surface-exposed lipoprotein/Short C-terminal domain